MNTPQASKYKTHTSSGNVTLYGLHIGYIQASPYYPSTKICLEWSIPFNSIKVEGTTHLGKHVFRTFTKLTHARAYLKSVI
jgi:hypothetical protein